MTIDEAMQLSDEQFWIEVSQTLTYCSWICPSQMCPEEIAFRLRDRVILEHGRIGLNGYIYAVWRAFGEPGMEDHHASGLEWFAYLAMPCEQVTCCLAAMGLWELTP